MSVAAFMESSRRTSGPMPVPLLASFRGTCCHFSAAAKFFFSVLSASNAAAWKAPTPFVLVVRVFCLFVFGSCACSPFRRLLESEEDRAWSGRGSLMGRRGACSSSTIWPQLAGR